MLKKVKIRNFKSWEMLDLSLKSVTALFGPNSSGKSSLIQFLLMLKQTKETADRSLVLDFGGKNSYTNLGSYHDVIFKHNEENTLSWELSWKLQSKLEISDPSASRKDILFSGDKLSLLSSSYLRNQVLQTKYLQYKFSGTDFVLEAQERRPSSYSLSCRGEEKFKFIRTHGRVWDIPSPTKSYAFPDQAKTYHQNADFLSEFELAYENMMDKVFYLGPLREYPKREYAWSGASPIDVGSRGERVIDALLAARARGEMRSLGYRKKKKSFDEIIAYWLKELGLIHDFEVGEIAPHTNLYHVKVRRDAYSVPVLITDVGFGVSQFLPVLVLLYYVPENSVVMLEQPEIHLHPAVQSGLADVIVSVAKNRNIQVIVESHSEHLLRRLQLRIAEEKITSSEVSIYFCEALGGRSNLNPIKVNIFGEIENWPPNFFGDEFEEISAIQENILKRKISNQ